MNALQRMLRGTGLGVRLMRSAVWTTAGYGLAMVLRLASNLILSRLLYPEAFGLMALITTFLVGLSLLSDVGIGPSIQQSKRGDDAQFLDTAWTIQILRGGLLWLGSVVLGLVTAWIYNDARLATMLPVAGLSLIIAGFTPTRIETANRHLALGRVTLLDLIAQVVSLVITLLLVWALRSVWSLVIGHVVGAIVRLVVMHWFLPGPRNRILFEADAVRELINFGRWIFLSSLCGFLVYHSDKAILGVHISLSMLGVYNIGSTLAGIPQTLALAIVGRVMISLYRQSPPGATSANYSKIRRMRFAFTAAILCSQFALALSGVWLVELMYDARFAAAGSVVVAIACLNIPYLIVMTYDSAVLAGGDSRGFFILMLARAVAQTTLFYAGASLGGLPWALAGVWLSQLLVYPLVVMLARRHKVWDMVHDIAFGVIGFSLTVLVLLIEREPLTVLWTF